MTLGKCILSRLHRHVGSSISTNINHPRLQRSTGLEEGLGGHNAPIYKIQFKRDTSSRKCGTCEFDRFCERIALVAGWHKKISSWLPCSAKIEPWAVNHHWPAAHPALHWHLHHSQARPKQQLHHLRSNGKSCPLVWRKIWKQQNVYWRLRFERTWPMDKKKRIRNDVYILIIPCTCIVRVFAVHTLSNLSILSARTRLVQLSPNLMAPPVIAANARMLENTFSKFLMLASLVERIGFKIATKHQPLQLEIPSRGSHTLM